MDVVSSLFISLSLIDSRRGCAEVTAQIPAEMCTAKDSLMFVATILRQLDGILALLSTINCTIHESINSVENNVFYIWQNGVCEQD